MNNYIWFSLAALFAMGCSSSNNTTTMADANSDVAEVSENIELLLVDRDWVLTSFLSVDGIDQGHSNEDKFSFTLRFIRRNNTDGSIRRAISGDVVCNGYAAEYAIDNNILSLTNSEITANACDREGEAPSALFGRVLLANEGSSMLSVRNNVLEVLAGSNEKLVFTENNGL